MPGSLSTFKTSVTGFPSMANSFSFVVGVAVAVSSITGMQRGTSNTRYSYSGLHVLKSAW